MSNLQYIEIKNIIVPETRFRKIFTEQNLTGLQDSMSSGLGLSNAITLRKDLRLITGGSRLKAMANLHTVGITAYYQGEPVPEGTIPAMVLAKDCQELEALEAELEENTKREGFTYAEEAQAIARIALLHQEILDAAGGNPRPPMLAGVPLQAVSKKAVALTAQELYEGKSGGHYSDKVNTSLKIANAIEQSSELGESLLKAKSLLEGKKILKKHAQDTQRAALAAAQGKTFNSDRHTILHGDCIKEMKKLLLASYDVCVTDPLYGIGGNTFNTASGKYGNLHHDYDDSPEQFKKIMPLAIKQMSRLLKDSAHLYLACDIRNYFALVEMVKSVSLPNNPWKIPNAPFIQYKVGGGRVPHPGFTPRRSYELWLYAYRGEKQEYKMINDVIPCEADRDYQNSHGAAKPVELLKAFLSRSCMPGDTVLDFMAGSGSILPACHELKLQCTLIEQSATYYGECLERQEQLV